MSTTERETYKHFNINQAPADMFETPEYIHHNGQWWGSYEVMPNEWVYITHNASLANHCENGWFATKEDLYNAIDKYIATLPA